MSDACTTGRPLEITTNYLGRQAAGRWWSSGPLLQAAAALGGPVQQLPL